MSKNIATPVPAKRVRAAYNEGLFKAPVEALPSLVGGKVVKNDKGEKVHKASETGLVRGRLHPAAVEAFNAQVKGEVYAGEKSDAEKAGGTVTLALTKPNAKGARLKRPEAFPLSEVRKRAGIEGKAGRIPKAALNLAAESIMRERGWL